MKTPDDLTIRITKNVKNQTTMILAYRKGGFKRAYKAVMPMCVDPSCKGLSPHSKAVSGWRTTNYKINTLYHPRDVDGLVKKLIKSYSS